jgi:hypothetical protein
MTRTSIPARATSSAQRNSPQSFPGDLLVDKKLSPPAKAAHASWSKIEQKCELYASECLGSGAFRVSQPNRQ